MSGRDALTRNGAKPCVGPSQWVLIKAVVVILAVWLNERGFRTRNSKRLPRPDGNLVAGPRRFATASVRGILHNPFYSGQVKHREVLSQGAHEALISSVVSARVVDDLANTAIGTIAVGTGDGIDVADQAITVALGPGNVAEFVVGSVDGR